ncbi:MAG: PQQ-binding-like beta-propeller repeat protein [Thermoanaerobaculia bacterium]
MKHPHSEFAASSRSRRWSGAKSRSAVAIALLLLAQIAAAHGTADAPGTITVDSVRPDSSAAAAGLEVGDRLLQLAGRELVTQEDLQKVLAAHQPGDTVALIVERGGETLDLTLTFGERPGGGVSVGVSLAIGVAGGGEAGTAECLAWIEETYHVDSMMRDLNLELAEDYQAIRECVGSDTRRMSTANAVKYCDNVFKVHCPGLDLLTEIGEAQVRRCEELLAESSGADPRQDKNWNTCAQHKVFDRYSMKGEASDEAACKAALDACGPDAGAAVESAEGSAEQLTSVKAPASWTQWGGPNRDFRAPAEDIANSWPDSGPEKLWSRELGGGYSGILFESGRLYTMYRDGAEEAVVCLDAGTGETVWEHRYEHRPRGELRPYGDGPSSTPLIAGELLFSVGIAGMMQALQKSDGKVVWSHDLWDGDFGGNVLFHGYSSSPVAHQGKVIVPVGGAGASLVAFDQKDGSVEWRALDFRNSFSSPSIVEIAGEVQLVVFMAEELIGVDPDDGALRWRYPHVNQWRHNISMPAVVGDMIFLSSPQTGAKGLRLARDGEAIRVEEVWSTRRVQLYHVASVRVGDWVYGSTGTASPAFMTAINVRTGEVGWRQRGFAKANCVEADGKLVILDENGVLAIATATPEKLVVHSETQLLDRVAWTVPTIVGKTLYVRDERQIMAVDLG